MNSLEYRKQLLLAESELNRVQLVGDVTALKTGVRALTRRATSAGSIAVSAAVLTAGLMALQRGQAGTACAKPSRFDSILKGAVLVSTLWLALSAPRRDRIDP